ncbi:MAG: hypothetical protein PHX09_00490 [Clostridia bacterium]|nr:hypothetical protein [Clostridia bacterium]
MFCNNTFRHSCGKSQCGGGYTPPVNPSCFPITGNKCGDQWNHCGNWDRCCNRCDCKFDSHCGCFPSFCKRPIICFPLGAFKQQNNWKKPLKRNSNSSQFNNLNFPE